MKTVIIGAGIQGLACAYALAKRGIGPITILETKRIGYGASSRSGGGIRAQFRNEPNIQLGKWSLELYKKLTGELGFHILFHHSGYMYINYSDNDCARAERDVALQNRLGVPSQLITPDEAMRIVPQLRLEGARVVQYNHHDAGCHHDALMWGYFQALRKLGVSILQGTTVSQLEKTNDRISAVIANQEVIHAEQVIVAAGTWTRKLLKTIGVSLPTEPWRREKLVSEPVRHFIKPLVSDRKYGVSIHQSLRGEVLGTAASSVQEPSMKWDGTQTMLTNWCGGIYKLFPALRDVKVMRQWAGTRDFSPDGTPIFGPEKEVEGLWFIGGQSGTGLMLAPAIAEAITLEIIGQPPRVDWETYSPRRFDHGGELWERQPTW
jgi:sarcosine oxidase subunit beta